MRKLKNIPRRLSQFFFLVVLGEFAFYGIFRCPFAVPYTDLHLKSESGRWDPVSAAWTNDPKGVLSPCIDAGDPLSDYSLEPRPNGRCVNMGAYGNTIEASKSAGFSGTMFKAR